MDKLLKIAKVFDTTVDYLLTGNRTDEKPLHNLRLLERFQALEGFDAEDQETVIKLLDAMIVKNKVEGVIKPFEKKASNWIRLYCERAYYNANGFKNWSISNIFLQS